MHWAKAKCQLDQESPERRDRAAPGQTVVIHGGALATSGTTVRRGPKGHHIIDPRTGKPATASRSVTIYAPTALLADEIDDAVAGFGLVPRELVG